MDIDPAVAKLGVDLAGLAAKKSAASIFATVRAAKQKSTHAEQVNELSDVINELVEERGHLIAIAQAYREELESRRLSDEDLTYVTTEIVPVVKQIADLFGSEDRGQADELVRIAEALLTEKTLTIMQMLGFDYREALGRPLTDLARLHILNQAPTSDKATAEEMQLLAQKRELALLEIAKDPDAFNRFETFRTSD
ncbi:hypothetical protein SAMN05428985_102189 [Nocardioides sp. YR527]|uniref:hypothetical protein n=1 Tax=Nocardioides sp. YR527 TaxID=1881028 RepID=UPI0008838437|nr:hypothetical protein [Nocardioides sp. YR527]SDJ99619.1 hypothetical protein SAMN05428985_102189 [Nocardioides sp. YR527]